MTAIPKWLCGVLLVVLSGSHGCTKSEPEPVARDKERAAVAGISSEEVARFCGDCHATPPASSFARRDWPDEVALGYRFFYGSERPHLTPPPQQRVVEYFQERAPEELEFHIPPRIPSESISFSPTAVARPAGETSPGVSHIALLESDSGPPRILFTDMSLGGVHEVLFDGPAGRTRRLCSIPHPCHVAACDLDQNKEPDLVVADLGSFRPADHDHGRVLWLRSATAENQEPVVLAANLGRVADVRPGDFDGDGDQDLIVAEFGWRETGSISALENLGLSDEKIPQFKKHVLDKRHGAIHTIPTDLNGDGRLDFVTLLAQEHEVIEAFLGAGDPFHFERKVIYAAPDPAFGSSGIELVDLDGDQDLDVVFTNGDAFDSDLPKPYHGIHWLENDGIFPFTYHQLALMPGVHRALPGDLDGDGDLDLVATAHLPGNPTELFPGVPFDSVLWLEQTSPGKFAPHVIESERCHHPACAVGDLDGDGDLDLVVGEFPTTNPSSAWLHVWRAK